MQRAFHEERAKARAIEEEIAFEALAGFKEQRGDVAGFAVELNLGDPAFDAAAASASASLRKNTA